jgi:hypothetical protein
MWTHVPKMLCTFPSLHHFGLFLPIYPATLIRRRNKMRPPAAHQCLQIKLQSGSASLDDLPLSRPFIYPLSDWFIFAACTHACLPQRGREPVVRVKRRRRQVSMAQDDLSEPIEAMLEMCRFEQRVVCKLCYHVVRAVNIHRCCQVVKHRNQLHSDSVEAVERMKHVGSVPKLSAKATRSVVSDILKVALARPS